MKSYSKGKEFTVMLDATHINSKTDRFVVRVENVSEKIIPEDIEIQAEGMDKWYLSDIKPDKTTAIILLFTESLMPYDALNGKVTISINDEVQNGNVTVEGTESPQAIMQKFNESSTGSLMNNVVKASLNMKGKTTNINGFQISESQWLRVVHCAHSLYENDGFDDEQYDDVEYRCSEIMESLRLQSNNTSIGEDEASQYDPQVDAFFEQFDEAAIELIISYGESKDWQFQ